jgi:hypothetical protein
MDEETPGYLRKYMPKELPTEMEFPYTIYYCMSGYDAGKIGVFGFRWDGDDEKVVLSKGMMTLPIVLKEDIQELAIATVKKAIADEQAESFIRVEKLKEKLQALLQIEYVQVPVDLDDEIPF